MLAWQTTWSYDVVAPASTTRTSSSSTRSTVGATPEVISRNGATSDPPTLADVQERGCLLASTAGNKKAKTLTARW